MCKRIFFAAVIIMLSFGLSAAYGLDAGSQKVSALQNIKNAYNNFRNRQQQKSQAAKVESPQAVAPKAQTLKKEATKEEMLSELREELAGNEDLFNTIPGLKIEEDAAGKVFYTFKGAKLEDLSKDDLNELFAKSHQAIVRVRTERIQRQLEIAANTKAAPKTMVALPQLPRMPGSPPSPPSIPSKPSIPRGPSLPPVASQRR